MNKVDLILAEPAIEKRILQKRIQAFIASIFSVLFSMSIVLELNGNIQTIVAVGLMIFTTLFLILNEKYKVNHIQKFTQKFSIGRLIGFVATLIVSITLSCIGGYLWTNKNLSAKIELNNSVAQQEFKIKSKYQSMIDSVSQASFFDTNEYDVLKNDLEYWKNRRPANVAERSEIRDRISDIESQIQSGVDVFNNRISQRKNDILNLQKSELNSISVQSTNKLLSLQRIEYISYIVVILVLIVEIAIIALNYDLAKEYKKIDNIKNSSQANDFKIVRKILMNLYLMKNDDDRVFINNVKHSPIFESLGWDDKKIWDFTKKAFNQFLSMNILVEKKDRVVTIKGSDKVRKFPSARLAMTENQALEKVNTYYNKLLDIS